MQESDVKKTLKFCSYRSDELIICPNHPTWFIANSDKKMKMRVCDEHLAWGVRKSGYPAIIDIEPNAISLTE